MLALALRVVALLTSLQEMPSIVYKMQENAPRPGLRPGPPAPDPDGGAYSAPQTSSRWGTSSFPTQELHPTLGLSGLGPLGSAP